MAIISNFSILLNSESMIVGVQSSPCNDNVEGVTMTQKASPLYDVERLVTCRNCAYYRRHVDGFL